MRCLFISIVALLFSLNAFSVEYYCDGRIKNDGEKIYYPSGEVAQDIWGTYYPGGIKMFDPFGEYYPNGYKVQDAWGAYYPNGQKLYDYYGCYLDNGQRVQCFDQLTLQTLLPGYSILNMQYDYKNKKALTYTFMVRFFYRFLSIKVDFLHHKLSDITLTCNYNPADEDEGDGSGDEK